MTKTTQFRLCLLTILAIASIHIYQTHPAGFGLTIPALAQAEAISGGK